MDTSGIFPVLVDGDGPGTLPAYSVALRNQLTAAGFRPTDCGITPAVTVGPSSWTLQTITFRPGLFSAPPLLFVTASTGQIIPSANVTSVTKDSAVIAGDNRGTATQNNVRLTWFAIQP